jgi:hypothetical protein
MPRFTTAGVGDMQLGERLKAFWADVCDRSRAGIRLRRRIAATAGMGLFAGGFLFAIGYGAIVLSVLAAALIVIVMVVFAAAWPRLQRVLGPGLRRLRRGIFTTVAALPPRCRQTWSRAKPRMRRVHEVSVDTAATVSRRAVAFTRRGAAALPPLSRQTWSAAEPRVRSAYRSCVRTGASAHRWATQTAQGTTAWIALRARHSDPRREALRLNAAGTRYRRDGLYDHAVDCHRRALEIFRALDDRRAVALTQSNLALALSHAGDDNWAIGLFEEAAATLRELGDEEHEAQIIANLGLAHRRHGRREQGDNVLELALSKLPPASSEYHAIEAELRRAS